MSAVRGKLSSNSLAERIVFSAVLMIVLFISVAVFSHHLLPEAVLRNGNPLQSWEESGRTIILAGQIFFYNLISVVIIMLASLFGSRSDTESNYLSTGYLAFYTLVTMNAIALGTWSFSHGNDSPPLIERLTGMMDIVHRSGLWEMTGQLLITCALAHMALVRTTGKATTTRHIRDTRLAPPERTAVAIAIILMLAGAIIESIAINV